MGVLLVVHYSWRLKHNGSPPKKATKHMPQSKLVCTIWNSSDENWDHLLVQCKSAKILWSMLHRKTGYNVAENDVKSLVGLSQQTRETSSSLMQEWPSFGAFGLKETTGSSTI